jgi:phenolic acid decarboxylase
MRKVILLLILFVAFSVKAQTEINNSGHLDGSEFQYTYEDGSEVVLTFYDGLVKFEFLQGPLAGETDRDIPYRSRLIDDQVYFIDWHNEPVGSFVTLYIDVPRSRLFGSALIWYNSDESIELFDAAVITRAELGDVP